MSINNRGGSVDFWTDLVINSVRFSSIDILLFLCQNIDIGSIVNHAGYPNGDSSLKGDIGMGINENGNENKGLSIDENCDAMVYRIKDGPYLSELLEGFKLAHDNELMRIEFQVETGKFQANKCYAQGEELLLVKDFQILELKYSGLSYDYVKVIGRCLADLSSACEEKAVYTKYKFDANYDVKRRTGSISFTKYGLIRNRNLISNAGNE